MLQIKNSFDNLPFKFRDQSQPLLYYKEKPLFAFGPMSETATFAFKLGSKAYDVEMWAKWQKNNGMGYVRCYAEQSYGWVDINAEGRLYPFEQEEPFIFNLDKFSTEYWENFRKVCCVLKENDIILHLQLVQVCYFKEWAPEHRRWQCNYWNPKNNVNDYTAKLKPEFPFSDRNPSIMKHWRRYLYSILNAAGDLGNVIIDLGNELTADMEWVRWNLEIIGQWEREKEIKIIKGLDYTHTENTVEVLSHPGLDVIITHGQYVCDVPFLRKLFNKPVITVISRDSGYLGLGEASENQDRFRKFHYRCFMKKVQGVGDYGKIMDKQELGKNILLPETDRVREFAAQAKILTDFVNSINSYEKMQCTPFSIISCPKDSSVHFLEAEDEAIIYLESGMNTINDGMEFNDDVLVFSLKLFGTLDEGSGELSAKVINPSTGEFKVVPVMFEEFMVSPSGSKLNPRSVGKINLPKFKNDILVYISSKYPRE